MTEGGEGMAACVVVPCSWHGVHARSSAPQQNSLLVPKHPVQCIPSRASPNAAQREHAQRTPCSQGTRTNTEDDWPEAAQASLGITLGSSKPQCFALRSKHPFWLHSRVGSFPSSPQHHRPRTCHAGEQGKRLHFRCHSYLGHITLSLFCGHYNSQQSGL